MDDVDTGGAPDAQRTFEIGPCLGSGGFGEVYHAFMGRPGGVRTEVALKVLHDGLSARSQAVERLRDEGRMLAMLRHPAIVKVLDLVELDGRTTLVSEYVEGVDLHAVRGVLPVRCAVAVIGILADALATAWRAPGPDAVPLALVHRDIKPANVRLGRHGEVKLLDFGIAKARLIERDASTTTGLVLGSVPYLAPERLSGEDVGAPGDVYALGATLYECLCGERLAAGLDVPGQVRLALDPDAHGAFVEERLGELRAPDEVVSLLRAMLAHEPEARPDASALVLRCDALDTEITGPTLRHWARGFAWPDQPGASGSLSGSSLVEGVSESLPAPLPTEPPPRRRASLALVLGGLAVTALLGLLCGGGALAFLLVPRPELPDTGLAAGPDTPETTPTAGADGGAPAAGSSVEAPTVGAGTDEPEAGPGVDAPEPIHAPEPAPVRTSPPPIPGGEDTRPASEPDTAPAAPASEPDTAGTVTVIGDAIPELRQGGRRFSPGSLPAGTYGLWYDFGEGLNQAGTIEVQAGQTVTIQCNRLRYECSSR